jgi:acyl-CoA thioester hydrolase
MRTHTCNINVRYAETDRMGVAHHSSYLLWFELARTGLLKEAGHAYRDMEAEGRLLPVIEYGCRMMVGAEYDDDVRIDTTITELRSRAVRFRYRVWRGDELLAEGWTRHFCVTADNTPRRIGEDILEAISPWREQGDD